MAQKKGPVFFFLLTEKTAMEADNLEKISQEKGDSTFRDVAVEHCKGELDVLFRKATYILLKSAMYVNWSVNGSFTGG